MMSFVMRLWLAAFMQSLSIGRSISHMKNPDPLTTRYSNGFTIVSFIEQQILHICLSTTNIDTILFLTVSSWGGVFQKYTLFYKLCITLGPLQKFCNVDHIFRRALPMKGWFPKFSIAIILFTCAFLFVGILTVFGLHTWNFIFFIFLFFFQLPCHYYFLLTDFSSFLMGLSLEVV